MSLIDLFLPTPTARRATDGIEGASYVARDVFSDQWYQEFVRPTGSRVSITQESALTSSAAFACLRLLSVVPSTLPLQLYKQNPGATDAPHDDSEFVQHADPRNRLVNNSPNPDMTAVLAKAQAFQQMVNAGNAYFEIERNKRGDGIAHWPIHHSRIEPVYLTEEDAEGDDEQTLAYRVKNNTGEPSIVAKEDILHFPYPISRDGISGKGIVERARESLGLDLAMERHGASYFGNGGIPRIVVTHPKTLSVDARKNFHKEWKEILRAEGNNVALVTEGAAIEQLKQNNNEAQFLEGREFSAETIARWYGVAVHLIQRGGASSHANLEQLAIEFVKFSLMPLTVVWEQELNRKLLTDAERVTMYFRFDFSDLLRPDSKALSEYIRVLIQIGVFTPDEGRIMVGKNPMGGPAAGLFMQGAMVPIELAGKLIPNSPGVPQDEDQQTGKDNALNVVLAVQQLEISRAQKLQSLTSTLQAGFSQLTVTFAEALASLEAKSAEAATGTREAIEAMRTTMTESSENLQATVTAASGTLQKAVEEKVAAECSSVTEAVSAGLSGLAEAKDTRETALLQAAKTMLLGAIGRMVRNQATAARRAANKPGEFLAFLDSFFGDDLRRNFAEAVQPVASALAALGIEVCPKELAETEVNQSKQELLKLSGECGAADLAAKVDARMQEWERERAAAVCESVMGGQAE